MIEPKQIFRIVATWRQAAGVNSKVKNDGNADWSEAWALFPGSIAYVWHGALHATGRS